MINKNLQALRKVNKLSQEALAEKIGVSRQTVAKWENGESTPDILSCEKIADTSQGILLCFWSWFII